jgi:putative PEP-CTERM system histidine kinase
MLHLLGAACCALAVVWLARRPVAKRVDRNPTLAALALTGLWAAVVSAYGSAAEAAELAEAARNLAWILVLYRLFAHDGRDLSMAQVRPVVVVLALVELMQPVLIYVSVNWAVTPELAATTSQIAVLFHILVAIGALVLLHNLYGGAAPETRDALRWSAAGLAGFWAFELNHYVVAYLSGGPSEEFSAMRGLVAGLMTVPLVAGASNGLAGRKLRASHSMTFQTLSLLVIGGYLLLMFGAAQLLSTLGGNFGRLAEIGFLVAAATVALLWLPSRKLRGWLRVTLLKHLFQHRYDYREEWMRFTRTISHHGDADATLYQRAAKAMADIVDSPAALVFLPGDDGLLRESAGWNWKDGRAELATLPADFASRLERDDFIVEIGGNKEQAVGLPAAIQSMPDAWALVPLIHFDRICGAVVLARPAHVRPLDWEDYDLLKVVGRQLASYLAEHESHSALMESAKFDDFNRRIAFVMHDIKNLASQLSLLARNAEKHAENPEFRKDMLVTLRSGSDKLSQLLARLGRYGTSGGAELREIDLVELGRRVAKRFEGAHPVALTRADPCEVLADPEGLEQAIVHLVQNGIDASVPEMPVSIDISTDGLLAKVEVIDSGAGMDAEFLRHRLFKPFVSSKDGGFGIGAFEARELVRSMGGRLDVQSRPGIGTRFSISIPLAEAARFLAHGFNHEAA